MARAKKHAEHANHERWLVSYADFITLLFAFFVVMFATSQTDKAKAKQVSDAVKEALENGGVSAAVHEIMGGTVDEKGKGNAQMRGPGGAAKNDKKEVKPPRPDEAELLPSLEYLNSQLRDEIKSGKIEMRLEQRGLVISLREAAFFPSAGDTVEPFLGSSTSRRSGSRSPGTPIRSPSLRTTRRKAARTIAAWTSWSSTSAWPCLMKARRLWLRRRVPSTNESRRARSARSELGPCPPGYNGRRPRGV